MDATAPSTQRLRAVALRTSSKLHPGEAAMSRAECLCASHIASSSASPGVQETSVVMRRQSNTFHEPATKASGSVKPISSGVCWTRTGSHSAASEQGHLPEGASPAEAPSSSSTSIPPGRFTPPPATPHLGHLGRQKAGHPQLPRSGISFFHVLPIISAAAHPQPGLLARGVPRRCRALWPALSLRTARHNQSACTVTLARLIPAEGGAVLDLWLEGAPSGQPQCQPKVGRVGGGRWHEAGWG